MVGQDGSHQRQAVFYGVEHVRLAKVAVIVAKSQALQDAVWNGDDNYKEGHFEGGGLGAGVVVIRAVEILADVVADGIGCVSERGDEGLPLVSHPDNSEIYAGERRGQTTKK